MKYFLVSSMLVMMFGVLNVQAQQSVQAKVIGLQGEATVVTPGGTERPLLSGDLIPEGSTVQTAENGNVVIGLLPGASTVVQTNTTLTIDKLEIEKKDEKIASRTVKLNMPNDKGGTLNFLNELDGASDYQIKTTQGIAAARGTAWQVAGGNISVINGTVTFTSNSGATFSIPQGSLFSGQSGTVTQMSEAEVAALTAAVKAAIDEGTATGDIQAALDIQEASNPANQSDPVSPEQ